MTSAYHEAGVDLAAADEAVAQMAASVTATWTGDVVGGYGGFAAGIRVPQGYADPVLMMSTDGVGTKAELARQADRLDGLGWDLVAMCVDDLAAAGARPIAMTDYLAVGRLIPQRVARIVASVAAACRAAGVALVGGETAEHPGLLEADQFDLAGAAVGVVEADAVVDGGSLTVGQAVLGLESPNLRSNGFSLIRHAILSRIELEDQLSAGVAAEVLLAPSVLYSPAVQRLMAAVPVAAMAHITGGGLPGNVPRVLPAHLDAAIDPGSWPRPAVFDDVARIGGLSEADMFGTFNMGVGFVVVVDPVDVDAARDAMSMPSYVIGEITPGSGRLRLSGLD